MTGIFYDAVFEDAGTEDEDLIDAVYGAKYDNATEAFTIPIMQGGVPHWGSMRDASLAALRLLTNASRRVGDQTAADPHTYWQVR